MPVPYEIPKGEMKYLTYETIKQAEFPGQARSSQGIGASLSFFGIVRDSHKGRKVTHLVYEAYESLAETMIEELLEKTGRLWPVLEARILHRLGTVEAGQIAVAIDVSSAHRDEAYRASRFLIDEIKSKVPIWKKEYFEDGIYHWGSCDHHARLSFPSLHEIQSLSSQRGDIKIFTPEKTGFSVNIQIK